MTNFESMIQHGGQQYGHDEKSGGDTTPQKHLEVEREPHRHTGGEEDSGEYGGAGMVRTEEGFFVPVGSKEEQEALETRTADLAQRVREQEEPLGEEQEIKIADLASQVADYIIGNYQSPSFKSFFGQLYELMGVEASTMPPSAVESAAGQRGVRKLQKAIRVFTRSVDETLQKKTAGNEQQYRAVGGALHQLEQETEEYIQALGEKRFT
jgi:hypothetical protein